MLAHSLYLFIYQSKCRSMASSARYSRASEIFSIISPCSNPVLSQLSTNERITLTHSTDSHSAVCAESLN